MADVGRPTVITAEIIRTLEQAFILGLPDEQACLFAGISPSAFYAHQREVPEFKKRKELLKQSLEMKSRILIASDIDNKDSDIAKWYLERKAKGEFSTKTEIEETRPTNVTIEVVKPNELDDGKKDTIPADSETVSSVGETTEQGNS